MGAQDQSATSSGYHPRGASPPWHASAPSVCAWVSYGHHISLGGWLMFICWLCGNLHVEFFRPSVYCRGLLVAYAFGFVFGALSFLRGIYKYVRATW